MLVSSKRFRSPPKENNHNFNKHIYRFHLFVCETRRKKHQLLELYQAETVCRPTTPSSHPSKVHFEPVQNPEIESTVWSTSLHNQKEHFSQTIKPIKANLVQETEKVSKGMSEMSVPTCLYCTLISTSSRLQMFHSLLVFTSSPVCSKHKKLKNDNAVAWLSPKKTDIRAL